MSYCFPIFEQWSIPNWGEILFPIEKKMKVLLPNFIYKNLFAQMKHLVLLVQKHLVQN